MTRVSAERVAYGGGQGAGQDTRIQMTVVPDSEQWNSGSNTVGLLLL